MTSILRLLSCLAAFLALSGQTRELSAQENSPAPSYPSNMIQSIAIGFDGKVLLGRWVPISIETLMYQGPQLRVTVEVLDGDAVPVRYEWESNPVSLDDRNRYNGLVRIGRSGAIRVEFRNHDNQILWQRKFSVSELGEHHQFLPSTTRLSLIVGLTDRDFANKLPFDRGAEAANAVVDQRQYFPDNWIGYESIDRLIVITQDAAGLPMNARAVDGLARWIRMGGFAMFSCGSKATAWFGDESGLTLFNVPALEGVTPTRRTGPLELLVNSNDQLVTDNGIALSVAKFSDSGENVAVKLDDNPVLFYKTMGLGTISVLACDVTEQPVAGWSAMQKLLALSLRIDQVSDDNTQTQKSGRVTHIGYNDLCGQLRAAMDQFGNVTFITFTTVALLIALFIVLIGPGDYLFLRRVVGRMEWTWLTFSVVVLGFCGLAFFLTGWTKSKQVEVNQVELIDIDAISRDIRGTNWVHMYRPSTSTTNVEIGSENSLVGPLKERWLGWQGLPGPGLGGMQNNSDLGLYKRDYTCVVDPQGSHIVSLPVQSAATRTLIARWTGSLPETPGSSLRQSPNTDALLGTFTNPLDVPLRACVLLYGDWAYLLERSLEPGESISVEDDMREKTIRGYYTRRREQGSDDVNVPWNTTDTDLERIMGMMMFYEVIGGEPYATLTNDSQRWLDLSSNLKLGQAVLVGHHREATTPLIVDGEPVKNYDKQLTTIRIVFPVEPRARRQSR